MLHQRDGVPALCFTFSDSIIESHLGLSVFDHKRFPKMDLVTGICEFRKVQQRQIVGRQCSDRSALEEIQNQAAGNYLSLIDVSAQ